MGYIFSPTHPYAPAKPLSSRGFLSFEWHDENIAYFVYLCRDVIMRNYDPTVSLLIIVFFFWLDSNDRPYNIKIMINKPYVDTYIFRVRFIPFEKNNDRYSVDRF